MGIWQENDNSGWGVEEIGDGPWAYLTHNGERVSGPIYSHSAHKLADKNNNIDSGSDDSED